MLGSRGVQARQTEPPAQPLEVHQRRAALAERDRVLGGGQHRAEAPEAARRRRQLVGSDPGQRGEVEADAEVDEDTVLPAARAAREAARIVEHRVASETFETGDASGREHDGG